VAWASCPCIEEQTTCRQLKGTHAMPVGRVVTFKAGDGVFIPAGEKHKHKARAVTEVVRLVLARVGAVPDLSGTCPWLTS